MSYFYLEPEVGGGLGPETVMDRSSNPPAVEKLHYHFDGWLGDDLIESFPCYLVTQRLAEELDRSGLIGFSTTEAVVTTSREFEELYPNRTLPRFIWLRVAGVAGKADFGMSADNRLVVSSAAKRVLDLFSEKECTVRPYEKNA
jgi:hypothetical protein